jgi:hypothetical protein
LVESPHVLTINTAALLIDGFVPETKFLDAREANPPSPDDSLPKGESILNRTDGVKEIS